jgi:hypothetical protein
MSSACSEVVWLRGLLAELGVKQQTPTPLLGDNMSVIHISVNLVFHGRTKHIEVDCHYIRDIVNRNLISLPHVPSDLQIADIFTKTLGGTRHDFLVSKLMLVNSPSSI